MTTQGFVTTFFLSLILLVVSGRALAEEESVVPDQEKSIAQQLGVDGPTETHGIDSSAILGSINLGEDFDALQGRSFRARRVTVAPGHA